MTPDPGSQPRSPDGEVDLERMARALSDRVDADAWAWLDQARDRVADDPVAVRAAFPAVSRRLGTGTLEPDADPDSPFAWRVDDAGRTLLVAALDFGQRAAELRDCYRHGDARERRGVLRALDAVDVDSDTAAELVADALRTNDIRLVAAALGPRGVATLDDDGYAQAVLKAVFVELDLRSIWGMPERVTPELSRMMADFVHERVAAGRTVPATAWTVIDRHPPTDRVAAIEAERDHADPHRAAAAEDALSRRADATSGSDPT